MSENQPTLLYAVSYGNQPGVYNTYKEAQAAMKGFPSAVVKKFPNREQAEEFLKKSKPESTSFEAKETDTDDKFYAVARGRIIGIFKDMDTVKKNTHGFPGAMHKKFNNFAEAKNYFEKFAHGKVEEKTPKKKRTHQEAIGDGEGADEGVKPVARKRTSGKVGETDESDGEHLDQTADQSQSLMNETADSNANGANESMQEEGLDAVQDANASASVDVPKEPETDNEAKEGPKPAVAENGEQEKGAAEEKTGQPEEGEEPAQKQAKMEE